MKTHSKTSDRGRTCRSLWKSPAVLAALVVTLLLVASRVVEGWNWPPRAFILVGCIVFSLGFTYELLTRNRDDIAYRAAVAIAFTTGFILMWGNFVQMADVNPTAAMYFGVPLVGIVGVAMARLRPTGMARALFVTALAQVAVLATVLILLVARKPELTTWTPPEWRGLSGNAVNAMLFAASALLFRKAARDESAPDAVAH